MVDFRFVTISPTRVRTATQQQALGAPGDVRLPSPVRMAIAIDADVVAARGAIRRMAASAGYSGIELTVIATAVSEIARNIVSFARGGEMMMSCVREQGRTGISIVARDAGPGIADVTAAMRDGVSTGCGLGLGLPGARRLMDEFDLHSRPGEGTTVSMVKWRSR